MGRIPTNRERELIERLRVDAENTRDTGTDEMTIQPNVLVSLCRWSLSAPHEVCNSNEPRAVSDLLRMEAHDIQDAGLPDDWSNLVALLERTEALIRRMADLPTPEPISD